MYKNMINERVIEKSLLDRLMDIMSCRVNILFMSSFIENFIIISVTAAEKKGTR